jgi:5S rRNA maturation endonuclease (ribonuclease M5)
MTLTETTAAIANALGLSYSVTHDAALLLRGGVVVGVVDDRDKARELDVCCYFVNKGQIFSLHTYVGSGNVVSGLHGKINVPTTTRQRVEAKDIKSRYTVLDVWRMLMPQSCPLKDGVFHSPFRDDSNPSFSISQQGRKWKDFSSDEGGDCLDFWMKATGGTLVEAIAALASGASNQQVLPMEPPKEKVLAVTDVQRGFEERAMNGWKSWYGRNDSVMIGFLEAKDIPRETVQTLHKEGSLGCIDGKPVFCYEYGLKIRHEAETSRSTRWLCGGHNHYPWRYRLLGPPHIRHVILTEGESDCMRLMSLVPQGLSRLIIAAPGVSWSPTPDLLHYIGSHRSVTIWFDNDEPGIKKAVELEQQFREVSSCEVKRVVMPEGSPKDLCQMEAENVVKIFGQFS